MDALALAHLLHTCAPQVHPTTAQALVAVESSFNPHAIGVVGGVLAHQPRSRAQALATAQALQASGWDFSVGLAQINQRNFAALGLSLASAFEPCANLAAMQAVLADCYQRARKPTGDPPGSAAPQHALRQALSCYYSGNFVTGVTHGYVRRIVWAAQRTALVSTPPKEAP